MRIVSAWETVRVEPSGDKGVTWKRADYSKAVFHRFGIDFESHDIGCGQYTTAIIELPDGQVRSVPANQIIFTNPAIKKQA